MRDRSFESQLYRASGLNFLVAAIILWNTRYLERGFDELRNQGHQVQPEITKHVASLGWEHIGLIGDYVWSGGDRPPDGSFRQLSLTLSKIATALAGAADLKNRVVADDFVGVLKSEPHDAEIAEGAPTASDGRPVSEFEAIGAGERAYTGDGGLAAPVAYGVATTAFFDGEAAELGSDLGEYRVGCGHGCQCALDYHRARGFRLAEFDAIAYIHPSLLAVQGTDESSDESSL
jgi:hypothetical protein